MTHKKIAEEWIKLIDEIKQKKGESVYQQEE